MEKWIDGIQKIGKIVFNWSFMIKMAVDIFSTEKIVLNSAYFDSK